MKRVRHVDMGELRLTVFRRDNWYCQALRLDPEHRCRNTWGDPVVPQERLLYINALTLEHVRMEPGGKRIDREEFCVTLCHGANVVEHWGSGFEHRSLLNDYLDGLYPDRRERWA